MGKSWKETKICFCLKWEGEHTETHEYWKVSHATQGMAWIKHAWFQQTSTSYRGISTPKKVITIYWKDNMNKFEPCEEMAVRSLIGLQSWRKQLNEIIEWRSHATLRLIQLVTLSDELTSKMNSRGERFETSKLQLILHADHLEEIHVLYHRSNIAYLYPPPEPFIFMDSALYTTSGPRWI